MKKHSKKIVSLMLALLMVFSLLPMSSISALAAGSNSPVAVQADDTVTAAPAPVFYSVLTDLSRQSATYYAAGEKVDTLLMRFTEIILSIPNLLLIIFLQAIMGRATIGSISIVIGLTSWFGIAKIIRTEVRQLRSSEYVIATKCMGGSFWHILWKHLAPNFVSSIMFMVVMNVRSAIVAESTLSFLGIGLPLDVISWGSMLSLAEKALMSRAWWIVLIPGIFLVVVLMCITSLGHWLQVRVSHQEAKL